MAALSVDHSILRSIYSSFGVPFSCLLEVGDVAFEIVVLVTLLLHHRLIAVIRIQILNQI